MFMKLLPYLIVAGVAALITTVVTIIDIRVYSKKVELIDQLHEAINRQYNNTQGENQQ